MTERNVAAGGELEIEVEGRLGVIALNRPSAINALTLEMVLDITTQLERWRDDPAIRAVLFEGRGPKGFCAGGDVRAVREAILSGDPERGLRFFAEEYAMNAAIANHPKPVVALCDGIVMGGGIGIAGHADFRFSTDRVRFAMPESAIGFVCDVGSNAILARAALHRALLFLMSGVAVGPADALALGLTDAIIAAGRMPEVRRGIAAAADSGDPETALVGLMQAEGIEPGDAALCAEADLCADDLALGSAPEIVASILATANAIPQLRRTADLLAHRCPTSLEAIVQGHLAARRLNDLEATLAVDLAVARYMSQRPDFAEGVRAVLIDKTPEKARWSPPGFDAGTREAIGTEIASAIAAG